MPTNGKERFSKSIMFKTWIGFVFLTIIILALLWLMQVFFFKNYYKSMKVAQITRIGNSIVNNYSYRSEHKDTFQQSIQDAVTTNQVAIAIFSINHTDDCINFGNSEDCTLNIKLYNDITSYNPNADADTQDFYIENDDKFFEYAIEQDKDVFTYQVPNPKNNFSLMVYGAKKLVHDETVYFYMTSVLTLMDGTTSILINQFIIVTCICIIMSLLLSYFISKRITSPITQFCETAKKLGKGDYNIKFEGNGFGEIEELAKTLNYTTSEMAKTEQLRRDFLANVSHDLRTPLTMIKAYAEMIRDISGENKQKRDLHSKVIIDEADRLTSLVNDILDLSKLQSGTNVYDMQIFNISDVTKSMYERFTYLVERDGYNINIDVDDNCYVKGDSTKLEQTIYNLIANAVNYTGDDKKINITLKKMGNQVKFSVTDTGKGIAKDEIDKVWDRYYRANQSKRGKIGSGIGLSIVKNVLVAHKAEYGIYSTVGKGSTFYFILDYVSPDEDGEIKTLPPSTKHKKNPRSKHSKKDNRQKTDESND